MSNNKYLDYLCRLVGKTRRYGRLLKHLHGRYFYSLVPNDKNREEDGKMLRERFINEIDPDHDGTAPDGEPSVLEVLIAIGQRLEFEFYGSGHEHTDAEWFWILIENLQLGWCDNEAYRLDTKVELDDRLDVFMDRTYSKSGDGGLFPLRNPQKDQRRIEIWYQMSEWINENYPI